MLGVEPHQFDTRNPIAPALKTILDWRRDHGYSPHGVPKKVAGDLCEAAFGSDGVIEAGDELPAGHLKAGAEYVAAVEKLGLRPHLAGWGWDAAQHGWLLVIVTSIYDAGGPLELNKLLFKAYNAGATPQQVSPFVVKVFSPEVVPQHFQEMQPGERGMQSADPVTGEVKAQFRGYLTIDLYGTKISGIHLIETRFEKPSSFQAKQREWQQFRRNVEKLAA